jgi:hypothetical protein
VVDHEAHGPSAGRAELFEECGLYFYDRDQRGDDIANAIAEADVGIGDCGDR